MDDVLLVEVLQPVQKLPEVDAQHDLLHGPEEVEQGRDGAPRTVLQQDGEVVPAVRPQVLDDVGMVQRAQGSHLSLCGRGVGAVG